MPKIWNLGMYDVNWLSKPILWLKAQAQQHLELSIRLKELLSSLKLKA